MHKVDRSVVQAVLAVLIVAGVFLTLQFGREGRIPSEALFGLVGIVVGYYFGTKAVTKDDDDDDDDDRKRLNSTRWRYP